MEEVAFEQKSEKRRTSAAEKSKDESTSECRAVEGLSLFGGEQAQCGSERE